MIVVSLALGILSPLPVDGVGLEDVRLVVVAAVVGGKVCFRFVFFLCFLCLTLTTYFSYSYCLIINPGECVRRTRLLLGFFPFLVAMPAETVTVSKTTQGASRRSSFPLPSCFPAILLHHLSHCLPFSPFSG